MNTTDITTTATQPSLLPSNNTTTPNHDFTKLPSNIPSQKGSSNNSSKRSSIDYRKYPPKYIYNITAEERLALQGKTIVGVDLNERDIFYCADGDYSKEHPTVNLFRLTRSFLQKNSKAKDYQKITDALYQTSYLGRTYADWKKELVKYSLRTTDPVQLVMNLQGRRRIMEILSTLENNMIFQKFKVQRYRNQKHAEQMFIKRFKETYGDKDKVVVCLGDMCRRPWEPEKHKKYRILLQQAGYKVYFVDEYKTSKKCCHCQDGHEVSSCLYRSDIKNNSTVIDPSLVHGLLYCKNGCNQYYNRDTNAAINICRIAKAHIEGKERPEYLRRPPPRKTDSILDNTANGKGTVKRKYTKKPKADSSTVPTPPTVNHHNNNNNDMIIEDNNKNKKKKNSLNNNPVRVENIENNNNGEKPDV